VNGFAEETMLEHLPGHELVEANQAFRNNGSGRFVDMPEWGLASTRGGRSMLMADLDQDGDLDIVVNNLRSAAQLFENRLCGGDALEVMLRMPGTANLNAIGATVRLHTGEGLLTREVRATSGYLTGEAPVVHFGLAPSMQVETLEILWPDGTRSVLEDTPRNALVTVTREEGEQ
jgi:hypothetical protein